MKAIEMMHAKDPREEILDKIKPFIDDIKVFHNQVLVATYMRPERTKSGLYLTDATKSEDEFQGKCGLVVKLGPIAFVDTDTVNFEGSRASVGDWIVYRPSDGWPMTIRDVKLRIFDDIYIKGTISSPDIIY